MRKRLINTFHGTVSIKTFERCQSGFKEREDTLTRYRRMEQEMVRSKTYKELKTNVQESAYDFVKRQSDMVQCNASRPFFKSIQNTAKNLIVMENYSRDQAWKYAICKRKYLLDIVLEEF